MLLKHFFYNFIDHRNKYYLIQPTSFTRNRFFREQQCIGFKFKILIKQYHTPSLYLTQPWNLVRPRSFASLFIYFFALIFINTEWIVLKV